MKIRGNVCRTLPSRRPDGGTMLRCANLATRIPLHRPLNLNCLIQRTNLQLIRCQLWHIENSHCKNDCSSFLLLMEIRPDLPMADGSHAPRSAGEQPAETEHLGVALPTVKAVAIAEAMAKQPLSPMSGGQNIASWPRLKRSPTNGYAVAPQLIFSVASVGWRACTSAVRLAEPISSAGD